MSGDLLDVMIPTTPEEAVAAFGDGDGITVLAGGTIVMPELTHGRLKPGKVLMLGRSGLDKITREGGTVTIGATVAVSELEELDEPLASAAKHVADGEIRAQATVGGNLCAPPGMDAPRGDLQAPLIALGARVRSTGSGGERTEPVEEFLAGGADRPPRARRLLRRRRPQGRLRRRLAAAHAPLLDPRRRRDEDRRRAAHRRHRRRPARRPALVRGAERRGD